MAFLCQRDSYLRTCKTTVVSCEPGKVKDSDIFKVKLKECIFFPEGGGQPYDLGTIDGENIDCVKRDGTDAIVFCKKPLEIGKEVTCSVEWERRYDHMQQHSAQHLLSKILEDKWKMQTDSWELGNEFSNVELDISFALLTSEMKLAVESEINQIIRKAIPVKIHNLTRNEAMNMFNKYSRRNVPDNSPEPIRIVEIKDVDMNMCCGTHVSNLSELQMVILLHEISIRGKIRLYFIAGNRVMKYIQEMIGRQNLITTLLNNGPKQHFQVIQSLKNSQKQFEKENSYLMKELAVFDLKDILEKITDNNIIHIHREIILGQYTNILSSLILKNGTCITEKIIIITSGGQKGCGQFCILSDELILKKISNKFLSIVDGKGSINKQRFQGKLNKIENLKLALDEIKSNK